MDQKFAAVILATLLTSACADSTDYCWTREKISTQPHNSQQLSQLRSGTFTGLEVLPDPGNFMTGVQFTGATCETHIWREDDGQHFAHPSFFENPVTITVQTGSPDFYLGIVDHETALVVQQYAGGVTASHVRFDEQGTLAYGRCGNQNITFIQECHSPPVQGN